jgi:hypothetical protein
VCGAEEEENNQKLRQTCHRSNCYPVLVAENWKISFSALVSRKAFWHRTSTGILREINREKAGLKTLFSCSVKIRSPLQSYLERMDQEELFICEKSFLPLKACKF